MGWKAIKEHYRIGHTVHVVEGKLHIGSLFVSDLIAVTPEGVISRAWDNPSGELARYIREISADPALFARLFAQEDAFTATNPVYTFEYGRIAEHACEEYGFPNVTHSGVLMYDNTFFKERSQAVDMARKDAASWIRMLERRNAELQDEIDRNLKLLDEVRDGLACLETEEVGA